jgi:hypothetical protein
LELQTGTGCVSENMPQWEQIRDGWIGTDSSKNGECDVEANGQGFPHSLEEGVEYDKSRKSGEDGDRKKNGRNNKQELEYDPEAVAKRLSKYKMNAVGEADMVARECILIGYSWKYRRLRTELKAS